MHPAPPVTEVRHRGWHPDPSGRHAERFYFADNEPGRLVRDDGRHEFYDDGAGAPGAAGIRTPAREPVAPMPRSPAFDPPTMVSVSPQASAFPPAQGDPTSTIPVAAAGVAEAALAHKPSDPTTGSTLLRGEIPNEGWTSENRRRRLTARTYIIGAVVLAVLAGVLYFSLSTSHPLPAQGGATTGGSGQATPHAGGSAIAGALPASSNPAGWLVTQTFATGVFRFTDISCPTVSVCYAVGQTVQRAGVVFQTTDGGAHWAAQPLSPGVPTLTAVHCASATVCTTVGGNVVLSTTNGGMSWEMSHVGSGTLQAVACPSVTVCVIAGSQHPKGTGCISGTTHTSTDGNMTWSSTPLGCLSPSGISCASTTNCELVGTSESGAPQNGQILGSGTSGASWSLQERLVGATTRFTAISCSSLTVCAVVGKSPSQPLWGTADGGATWAPQQPPAHQPAQTYLALSCQLPGTCQATGTGDPIRTANGGTVWRHQVVTPKVGPIYGVSCPSPTQCAAVAKGANGGAVVLEF
jgi:photosystem II stability/assembly factor-like uncharacterized protein